MSGKRLIITLPMLLAFAALTAGCKGEVTDVRIDHGITLHQGHVTIHAADAPDAVISKSGVLNIGGTPVDVTADQHQRLRQYYQQTLAIEKQGIAVGKAGGSMAGGTVGDVMKNLFNGHPDRIDADVHKRTHHLLAKVAVICDSLGTLRGTQDTLRTQIPAFKPYARIRASDVEQCHEGVERGLDKS